MLASEPIQDASPFLVRHVFSCEQTIATLLRRAGQVRAEGGLDVDDTTDGSEPMILAGAPAAEVEGR
ncbi:hypothetical protein BE15_19220 [Sorangium cellulosum]|uniref:Uncharacterized protein n=1 Tax=Sorangium cellulosum TaxID=56 RepID=A0A150QRA1_SORCE|nr:hypothetical protein BE15_19220 [Sorangium cellulosum]